MKTKLTTQKNLKKGKSKNTSVTSSKDKHCKWFQEKKCRDRHQRSDYLVFAFHRNS